MWVNILKISRFTNPQLDRIERMIRASDIPSNTIERTHLLVDGQDPETGRSFEHYADMIKLTIMPASFSIISPEPDTFILLLIEKGIDQGHLTLHDMNELEARIEALIPIVDTAHNAWKEGME